MTTLIVGASVIGGFILGAAFIVGVLVYYWDRK